MIPEPRIDEYGLPCYDEVPEGFVQATMDDLKKGYFKHNAPYLLKSFHYGVLSPRRVKYVFNKNDMPWLEAGMLYIYKPSKK